MPARLGVVADWASSLVVLVVAAFIVSMPARLGVVADVHSITDEETVQMKFLCPLDWAWSLTHPCIWSAWAAVTEIIARTS